MNPKKSKAFNITKGSIKTTYMVSTVTAVPCK